MAIVNYQDILKNYYGGSPGKYASAILEKRLSNQPLSNPTAAAAFEKLYSQFFPPEGYKPIKSYFPGQQVSYDPTKKMIGLPGGLNIPQSQLKTYAGRTYAPASQLAQTYGTYAAAYKPPKPTAKDIQRKTEQQLAIYNPILEALKSRLGLEQQKLTETAGAQRRLAEAAYKNALAGLGEQESQELRSTAHTVAGRGLGSSPLAEYQRRKVQEVFGKERGKLETESAAQLSNIATQAMLSANELAQKGKETEADWASKIGEYAYKALQQEESEQQKVLQDLAKYFSDIASSETKNISEAEKLAWEKEKAYIPYAKGMTPKEAAELAWKKENAYIPYTAGPKPAELLRYEYPTVDTLARIQAQRSTPTERRTSLTGAFYQLGTGYKSPNDFKADLQRYGGEVSQLIGAANYRQLLVYLDKEQTQWKKEQAATDIKMKGFLSGKKEEEKIKPVKIKAWGSNFVPGQKSPLRKWLQDNDYL